MDNSKHALWVEKYRPSSLTDYVFQDSTLRTFVESCIEEQTIPHLLLSGIQGSGKTTLAYILINHLNIDPSDVLTINASDENRAEVVRDKIKSFITTFGFGDLKIVHLEEADYISLAGQAIMRKYMEEGFADRARFIITCNYESKIIPAIRSRCQHFRFKRPIFDDVVMRTASILVSEKIKFDVGTLDQYVRVGFPDTRKIINLLQQSSKSGTLPPLSLGNEAGDYKIGLLDLMRADKWREIRQLLCAEVSADEWEDVYRTLYDNLDVSPKFKNINKWEQGILTIAEHLHKDASVSDREINASAMLIKLSQI